MASRPVGDHAQVMVDVIILIVTGLVCLALLAAVLLGYSESRRAERERRVDR